MSRREDTSSDEVDNSSDEVVLTCKVGYSFDEETGFGFMYGHPIFVKRGCGDPSYHDCVAVEHPNKISCNFLDSATGNIVCRKWDQSLEQYFRNWAGRGNEFISVYRVPHHPDYPVVPKNDYVKIRYFNPFWRKIVKQMLQYVVDMHLARRALAPFEVSDIGMVGHQLKFLVVPFAEYTIEKRRENLQNVARVIKDLFKLGENCSDDLADLLCKLNGEISSDWEEVEILNHLSITPPSDALKFIINMGRNLPYQDLEQIRIDAIEGITLTSCVGWGEKLVNNNLGHLKSCWAEGAAYCRNECSGRDTDVKHSLIRCAKNLAAHMKDGDNYPRHSDLHILLMILHVFQKQIYEVHHNISSIGPLDQRCWFESM